MRLPEPKKTAAVLIGTNRYVATGLLDLPSVRNNLDDLLALLTDPRFGGLDRDRCSVLVNPTRVEDVYRTLRKRAEDAEDTLLVYFAGHGLVGDNRKLFLGLRGTNLDELPVTAFEYDMLADVVRNSRARNRVVILDCCFSGLAVSRTMAGLGNALPGLLDIEGTFVLTSSPANQLSVAPVGERNTTFTGELLHLLTTGLPGGPELLTLTTVFTSLLASAKARGLPEPRRLGTGTVDHLALSRNPASHGPPGTSPAPAQSTPPQPLTRRRVSNRLAVGVLASVAVLAAGIPLGVHWMGSTAGPSAQPPLKVLSATAFRSTNQSPFFVLPDPVSMSATEARSFTDEVSRQSDRFQSWYTRHGGAPAIDAGFTNLTVRSNTGGRVRLTDMAVVKKCREPFDGTAMIGYTQGGGEESIGIGFDLDSPAPVPQQMANTTGGLVGTGVNYFSVKTVVVEPDASLSLSLGAFTKTQSCTFTFRLTVATDDGTVTQDVDYHGKPFAVTAKAAPRTPGMPLSGYRSAYVQNETLTWSPVDPANYTQE